jgi:hypothetical protein
MIWDSGFPRAGARGFALLDLMISVLILGLLLVPLALARNNVILSAGETVQLRKARILAAAKIGELEAEKPDALATGAGDFGPEHPGFAWETQVETLPLWEVVGRSAAEGETAATLPGGALVPVPAAGATGEAAVPEVIRLTLRVKFDPGEQPEAKPAAEDEVKSRPIHTIEIVRYWRKEPEEEAGK